MSRGQNSTAFVSNTRLGPVMHSIIIAAFLTILGFIYLSQATSASGYDSDISLVDSKITELEIQKKDLEIESARLGSLNAIKNTPVSASMSEPSDVQYVRQ